MTLQVYSVHIYCVYMDTTHEMVFFKHCTYILLGNLLFPLCNVSWVLFKAANSCGYLLPYNKSPKD